MRKSTIYLFILGFAVVVLAALASAGLAVSAQKNTNTKNTNTGATKPKPRYRRPPPVPWRGRCDNTKQDQTDLSGSYTGKLKHGDEPEADATLTITGNKFTATSGSETHSGQVAAVTTCGYTAVTMMMEGAPSAMSLRAKKVGDNLTLTSVPGEPQKVWFSTGGAMKPMHRRHRTRRAVAPPPPTKTTP